MSNRIPAPSRNDHRDYTTKNQEAMSSILSLLSVFLMAALVGCGSKDSVTGHRSPGAATPVFGKFEGGEAPDGSSIDPSSQLEDAIGGTARLSRTEIEANALLTDQVKAAVL